MLAPDKITAPICFSVQSIFTVLGHLAGEADRSRRLRRRECGAERAPAQFAPQAARTIRWSRPRFARQLSSALDAPRRIQKVQEKWFVRQLETAQKLDCPLIFHERDSNGRFFEILCEHSWPGMKGVVHCFSGRRHELRQYLDLGLYIGITGIATIKKRGAKLRRLTPEIPAGRLLVETDAPFLTPAPEKNHTRRNEPAFVKSVLLKVAEVRREDSAKLAANPQPRWASGRSPRPPNDRARCCGPQQKNIINP